MERPGNALEQAHQLPGALPAMGGRRLLKQGFVMLARLERIQGNPESCPENHEHRGKINERAPFRFKYTIWVKYALVRLWIAQGNFEKASRIVQESGITIDDEIPYLREPEFLAPAAFAPGPGRL